MNRFTNGDPESRQDDRPTRRFVGDAIDEALTWLDRERDAAWTTKLVIVRVDALDDVRHFGDCLAQHERHVGELARWIRARGATLDALALCEPSFVTPDPHAIGALSASGPVLYAMEALELARVGRYDARPECRRDPSLDRLLAAHRDAARARLRWLRRRLGAGAPYEAAAQ
jgi:hypothetical protein